MDKQIDCQFCEGRLIRVFRWNSYDILRCRKCGTAQADPMPTPEFLKSYYNQFNPDLNRDLPTMRRRIDGLFTDIGLETGRALWMLDVGGGGGYYCKSFESLGYGKSVYVDLDPAACRHASEVLGLERVYNCDVADLKSHLKGQHFDFIYSRHVAEHLLQPIPFILSVMVYLNPSGRFVLQVPNGGSLEFLGYWRYFKHRLSRFVSFNPMNRLKAVAILLNSRMLQGIDPPRHLWAFTKKGLSYFLNRSGYPFRVYTRKFTDPRYTPHIGYKSTWEKIKDRGLGSAFSFLRGGVHLVFDIHRDDVETVSEERGK